MGIYRSALGKSVDMSALVSKNEKVRAVGNMKVNARGDTVDGFNRVINPVNNKVVDRYEKTVGNKSAQAKKPPKPMIKEQLTAQEQELEDSFEDDLAIEQIKKNEMRK